MARAKPTLSKTEWTVMNVCWRLGTATARQIYEDYSSRQKRDYRTVKTLLDRIAVKGFLQMEKLGPLCLFTPAVSRRAALGSAIQEFVDVVLDNTLTPLFVHLAEQEELGDEELAVLQERFGLEKKDEHE
jgi:BlaI family penicillinase repressor